MRKLICVAALVAALTAPATVAAETAQERCSSLASLAHSIMASHQEGVALSDTLAIIERNNPEPEIRAAYEELVLMAYGEPRYQTEAAQARSAADFRDTIHVWCLS